ncbi:hypothetical protein F5Y04DRAFT_288026 [Hypomontagnella monticulosa]|nr:hypothetical protein F5Y04DRAFT_288026 [Hypomontagnella monticulosa]
MSSHSYSHANTTVASFPLLHLPIEQVLALCRNLFPDGNPMPPFNTFYDYENAKQGIQDLANLTKSCRALHILLSPILQRYRNCGPFHAGVIPYLRRIHMNPGLAGREPCFAINSIFETRKLEEGDLTILQTNQAVADPVPFGPGPSILKDFIFAQRWSIVTDAIISRLPNISSITLRAPTTPNGFHAGQGSNFAIHIDSLRHLKIAGFVDRSKFPIVDLSLSIQDNLFRLLSESPNLETLEVEFIRMPHNHPADRRFPIHSLHLRGCHLGLADLEYFDSGRLEEFIFHSPFYETYLALKCRYYYRDYKHFTGELTAYHIVEYLSQSDSRASLQTLEICTRELMQGGGHGTVMWQCAVRRAVPITQYGFFCTQMKCFTSLRSLAISQHAIWEDWHSQIHAWEGRGHAPGKKTGRSKEVRNPRTMLVSLLPLSVESFTLYDATAEFFPNLVTLGHNIKAKGDLPNLKGVHLYPKPDLCRRLTHARAHQGDKGLANHDCYSRPCKVDTKLPDIQVKMMQSLEEAGLEATFSMEAYPIFTDSEEDLQRQNSLGHWCAGCHYDDDAYAMQPICGDVPTQLCYELPDPTLPDSLREHRPHRLRSAEHSG